jgi:aryl-alcohol dehydrogenase-like predicted oxidoreductase
MSLDKLCYGTWQFESSFNKVTRIQAVSLIEYAIDLGINNFDTALAYGNGEVENILSEVSVENKNIITKIPAKRKPTLQEGGSIDEFYDKEWMKDCISKSIKNLKTTPTTVLLHNWSDNWEGRDDLIDYFKELKNQDFCKNIGLSLPNFYDGKLSESVLNNIDILEVPFNENNKWIENNYSNFEKNNIDIITRSLFLQGKTLNTNVNTNKLIKKSISQAANISKYVAIGMTSKEQIDQNVRIFKDLEY